MHGSLMAFQDYNVLGGSTWVGVDNFAAVLYARRFRLEAGGNRFNTWHSAGCHGVGGGGRCMVVVANIGRSRRSYHVVRGGCVCESEGGRVEGRGSIQKHNFWYVFFGIFSIVYWFG